MKPDTRFLDKLNELAGRFESEQAENLAKATDLMADAIEKDRLIYIFGGGGHTCLVMQELFWRAGGLANLCPMIDFAIHPATPAYMYLAHERMHGVGNLRKVPAAFEVADIAIDNYVPFGDTVIQIEGMEQAITGISSTIDFYIAHRLEMECVKTCVRRGIQAPVWCSANIVNGDEKNAVLRAKYNSRVKFL